MNKKVKITLHHNDLPDSVKTSSIVAVDTEALGLNHLRDRLCLVQLCFNDGEVHLVKISRNNLDAPNLKKILSDDKVMKLFHFARFDVAILYKTFGLDFKNIYCTKIASKIARTYTDSHSLKELCRELVGVNLSKQQQSSYWGSEDLTEDQKKYAASDVLYLQDIMEKLNIILNREKRYNFAKDCFKFLPTRVKLDLAGYEEGDIFAH